MANFKDQAQTQTQLQTMRDDAACQFEMAKTRAYVAVCALCTHTEKRIQYLIFVSKSIKS